MSLTPPIIDSQPSLEGGGGLNGTPSPSSGTASNVLGLALPPSLTSSPTPSVLTTYPQLGHYIFNLLASIQTSPHRLAYHHPLSVSSSSDDEERDVSEADLEQKTARKNGNGPRDGLDRDGLVRRIVEMLDNEEEEEVKEVLKPHMGDLGKVS